MEDEGGGFQRWNRMSTEEKKQEEAKDENGEKEVPFKPPPASDVEME